MVPLCVDGFTAVHLKHIGVPFKISQLKHPWFGIQSLTVSHSHKSKRNNLRKCLIRWLELCPLYVTHYVGGRLARVLCTAQDLETHSQVAFYREKGESRDYFLDIFSIISVWGWIEC